MIKNERASRYRRSWLNAATKVQITELNITKKIQWLKLHSRSLDAESIGEKVVEIRGLKELRKVLHQRCKKYKMEFKINNQ